MRRVTVIGIVLVVAVLGVVLTVALAGRGAKSHNGSKSASSSAGSAATQVSLNPVQRAAIVFSKDAGQAFSTFDKEIYVPYQHGAFKSASPALLAAAGRTALQVSEEIHSATLAADQSPQLAPLRAPMKGLDEGFKAALVKLKQGHFNFGEIQAASVAIASIRGAAASAGLTIPG